MKKIINPIAYYNEYKLLLFGILGMLIGIYLSYHYEVLHHGILQASPGAYSIGKYASALVIDVALLTLFTWIVGILINKKTRFIDILNVNLIARIPLHFLPIIAGSKVMLNLLEQVNNQNPNALIQDPEFMGNMISILCLSLASLLLLGVFLLLYIIGFRTAVHAKKWHNYLSLILILFIADICARIINNFI